MGFVTQKNQKKKQSNYGIVGNDNQFVFGGWFKMSETIQDMICDKLEDFLKAVGMVSLEKEIVLTGMLLKENLMMKCGSYFTYTKTKLKLMNKLI